MNGLKLGVWNIECDWNVEESIGKGDKYCWNEQRVILGLSVKRTQSIKEIMKDSDIHNYFEMKDVNR